MSSLSRRFAVKRCARCHLGISSNELVMRAREHVYHIGCFTCASCNKALTTGDYFGMKENMIYCRSHYEIMLQDEYMPSMSPAMPPGPQTPIPYYNGVGTTQKGRPRKRKSPGPDGDPCGQGLGKFSKLSDGEVWFMLLLTRCLLIHCVINIGLRKLWGVSKENQTVRH